MASGPFVGRAEGQPVGVPAAGVARPTRLLVTAAPAPLGAKFGLCDVAVFAFSDTRLDTAPPCRPASCDQVVGETAVGLGVGPCPRRRDGPGVAGLAPLVRVAAVGTRPPTLACGRRPYAEAVEVDAVVEGLDALGRVPVLRPGTHGVADVRPRPASVDDAGRATAEKVAPLVEIVEAVPVAAGRRPVLTQTDLVAGAFPAVGVRPRPAPAGVVAVRAVPRPRRPGLGRPPTVGLAEGTGRVAGRGGPRRTAEEATAPPLVVATAPSGPPQAPAPHCAGGERTP